MTADEAKAQLLSDCVRLGDALSPAVEQTFDDILAWKVGTEEQTTAHVDAAYAHVKQELTDLGVM